MWPGRGRDDRRPRESEQRRGYGHRQPRQRARRRDVEERVAVARRRSHADDRAHRARREDHGRRGDEVRQAHGGAAGASREVMTELVHDENAEQCRRERHAAQDPHERLARCTIGVERRRPDEARSREQRGETRQQEEHGVPHRTTLPTASRRCDAERVAVGGRERIGGQRALGHAVSVSRGRASDAWRRRVTARRGRARLPDHANRRYAPPVLGHRFLAGADALPETRVWQPRPPPGTPSPPSSRFDRPAV